MKEILVQIVFGVICVNHLLILYFFVKSQGGGLKKEFVVFFVALAWAAMIRTVEPLLRPELPPYGVSLIVATPVLLAGTHLVMFLFRSYRTKE
jgi:hypothetical protein